jgi:hypothetical protein
MRFPETSRPKPHYERVHRAHRMTRSAWLSGSLLLVVLTMAACARVAPYDREKLAHPSMTTADVAGPAEGHVRSIHEGATGGVLGAGGGCGCN